MPGEPRSLAGSPAFIVLGAWLAAACLALPGPGHAQEAACERGVALVDRGGKQAIAEAMQAFDACLSSASMVGEGRALAHVFRGSLRLELGRADEARQDFEAAIAARPEPDVYDYHYLAAAYAAARQFDKAHATLDRARAVVRGLEPRRHPALLKQLDAMEAKYRAQQASLGGSDVPGSSTR